MQIHGMLGLDVQTLVKIHWRIPTSCWYVWN